MPVVPPEETTVEVVGVATANPQAPGGVEVTEPVTWRHPAQRAKWELAAASLRGFRETLDGAGFTEIQTPKLVASATESGANVFQVDYFGRPAYLAQSPQFYKQQMVGVFERVYEVGPVFRAEPHDTVRHLAEYVSLDAELGFIEDHRDVLRALREVLAGMVGAIHEYAAPAVELTGAWALAEHGSDFLAVEGYPMAKRPFYTHPQADDARWSNSFDLLFRGLELVTGGQRLHRPSDYDGAIRARGEDPATYAAYLQAFEHGMPPHGGFAIGLERWTGRVVEAANVREVTLFPRDLHRLTP